MSGRLNDWSWAAPPILLLLPAVLLAKLHEALGTARAPIAGRTEVFRLGIGNPLIYHAEIELRPHSPRKRKKLTTQTYAPRSATFMVSGFQWTTLPCSMLRLVSKAAPAARKPKTASSTTGVLLLTELKKLWKWS